MLRDVLVYGDDRRRNVRFGTEDIDASRLTLIPSLVDLATDPGFPGFPVREDLTSLGMAAAAGGFTDLLLGPQVDPVADTPEVVAAVPKEWHNGPRLYAAGAATVRLAGEELAEIGLMKRAGARVLSDGGHPIRDTVVLRNLLEYAGRFRIGVHLRPADADLDRLGVVHESGVAAQVGLRGNPAASEEIGVARIVALVRATRASVHMTHLGTAAGVALLRAARAEGLPISGSTPARNLVLDESAHLARPYDTRLRLHPPLRSAADRAALVDAVQDGTLLLCADHAPRAPEEKDLEFERAAPGSTGLESAFAAALTGLDGDLDAVVQALSAGPRAVLGIASRGWALVDPDVTVTVAAAEHRSRARNDALDGLTLRGAVLGCWANADVIYVG